MKVLEAEACFNGKKYELYNRVCWYKDALYYDLTNEKWQVVKITKDGWSIIDNPPILFRRHTHQKQQVLPDIDTKH